MADDAAAASYGYDHDTLTSLTIDRIVAEQSWPIVHDIIAKATPLTDVEGLHQHADGHPLPVRETARAMEDGRPFRLTQVQDLTEVVVTRRQVQDYPRNVASTIARTVRARDPYTHRHQERVDYATHKRVEVRDWLAANRRIHVHFTPTSGSWLNLVEVWFGIIQRQAISRGTFGSVKELNAKIHAFVSGWNDRSHPFVWTKTPDQILAKANRQQTSNTGH